MNPQLLVTLTIVAVSIGFLVSERLRADLVALLMVLALGFTGVLTPEETFSGLSRSAVITVLAVFILAEGLRRAGVTDRVGSVLSRLASGGEARVVAAVMATAAALSLFMNNIAAASVLLPAVTAAGRKAAVNPARTLLPLAFATLLGGSATLLTTSHIVVSSLLRDRDLPSFGLLEFAPVGLVMLAIGVAYVALVGRRLLPVEWPAGYLEAARKSSDDLVGLYRLGERLFRIRVPRGSALHGKSLEQSALRERYDITVIAIERAGGLIVSPPPGQILREDDVVLLAGDLEELQRRDIAPHFEVLPPKQWSGQDLESGAIVIAESVLAPRSSLIGQTLRQAHFREKYGMTVLAVWRGGAQIRAGLQDLTLQFGDALLLQGPDERLRLLASEPDLIVLGDRGREPATAAGKGGWALAIMAATLVLAAFNASLIGEIMLGGALVMVLAKVVTMDQAYQAVDWKSIFLIAGMLPLGIAVTRSGAAGLLAELLVDGLGAAGPRLLLAGIVVVTVLLTQAINGAAVAAIMAPVAIEIASRLALEPRSLAMAVALATSVAFMSPLGHPVNVLVMGPGGYRFRDYFRVGLPLTVLLTITIVVLLPVFWPLAP